MPTFVYAQELRLVGTVAYRKANLNSEPLGPTDGCKGDTGTKKDERERLQREDQLERREAVKLAVSVLENAITRLGLRDLVNQSTNNPTSDFWKPLKWHIKHKRALWDQHIDIPATVDKYI
jgi:hypothetical protein